MIILMKQMSLMIFMKNSWISGKYNNMIQ